MPFFVAVYFTFSSIFPEFPQFCGVNFCGVLRMKSGIVFINLGTPRSPKTKDVRAFLREFLSDRRVVEVPRLLWIIILYLVILPFRSPKAAKAYRQIWFQDISPLRFFSEQLVGELEKSLSSVNGVGELELRLAMTYGEPSVATTISELQDLGCSRFLFIPLFPQYSATTSAAVFDQIANYFLSQRNIPQWSWVKDYHNHPLYISALADSVTSHWQRKGRGEKLLISFHGIPLRNVQLGDPYQQQCEKTAVLLAEELGLGHDEWQLSYQSRLGKAEWLQPYTDKTVADLAKRGLKKLDVICPAFATECLETLEEIDGEASEIFRENGGEVFNYIPCLNAEKSQQKLMMELCRSFLNT